jgi:hypothetical protein
MDRRDLQEVDGRLEQALCQGLGRAGRCASWCAGRGDVCGRITQACHGFAPLGVGDYANCVDEVAESVDEVVTVGRHYRTLGAEGVGALRLDRPAVAVTLK